jgi:hypothetical protein
MAPTDQDRQGVTGVHDPRGTGGVVDPNDLSGHEVAVICEPAQCLVREAGLLGKSDAAAASVPQCPNKHGREYGRVH